jgi:hypothetical protein
MAQTFVLSQRQAESFLNLAQKQLNTAENLNGELAASVAVQNVPRAENLYGQVNTFLGLAQTNNSNAGSEISAMATQATVEPERQLVQAFTGVQKNIQDGINSVRRSSQNLLARLNETRYNEANNVPTPPADSSGEEVIAARQARLEDAVVSNPPPPLIVNDDAGDPRPDPNLVSAETNAETPPLEDNEDLGANDGASSVVGGDRDVRNLIATQNNGPFAPNDDNIVQAAPVVSSGSTSDGRPQIAPEFLAPIVAQPNPLAKLASMTYTVSIYIMNIEEYQRLLISQKKVLPTQQLIIQSGGIDQGLGFGTGQRNKFFDVDFYLDNLVIESAVGTQAGTRAHNATDLKFTVVEPTGITFIDRLRKAVRQHQTEKGSTVSEGNQNFLMIVRFYGYDALGKMVNGSQLGITEVGSDTNTILEKWIPFQMADVRYKISAKTVEYQITATVPQTNIAFSDATATIPFDFELSAPDVKTLLNGRAVLGSSASSANGVDAQGNGVGIPVYAEDGSASNLRRNPETGELYDPGVNASAPPKASSLSNARLYTQGLCEALNQHQLDLVSKGQQEVADQYEIILENVPGLADAKMARPGKQDKLRSTMPVATTAAEALLPGKTRYDNQSKNWSVTRGTQIVQLIDLVMRNSSYITSQQNIVFDEVTLKPRSQTPVATVQWFRIRSRVTPLKYDNIRRTIAYKITYIVSRYQINDPRVPVFPRARYRGAHKIYNYWFTGQNSEVLDLDITVNYNYTMSFGNSQGGSTLNDLTSDGRLYEKRYFQNKPNSEGTGGQGDTTTPAAQLSERLYSDSDIEKAQLTIVGDPDWLVQSDVFYNRGIDLKPFMPDGSVNTDASEVLYEIRVNPVADYNITNGLAEVNAKNQSYSQATGENNLASVSTVFTALKVQSTFRQGRFTQKLEGAVRRFDPRNADQTAQDVARQSGAQIIATRASEIESTGVRTVPVENEIDVIREQFRTDTPAAALYTDPMGSTDSSAILDARGTAVASQVRGNNGQAPGDDAAQISDIVAP